MKVWKCFKCSRERITEDNVITSVCRCGEYFTNVHQAIQIEIAPRLLAGKKAQRLITREQRYEVLKRQKWKCNTCGTNLKYNCHSKWEGEIAQIDHIWPYSKREYYPQGEENINETSNLQALCPKCNKSKSNRGMN